MRDIIDRVYLARPHTAIRFHGTPGELEIDPHGGTRFSSFDNAASEGSNVYECRINLANAFFAKSEDDLAEVIASISHGAPYDGCVIGHDVIVFDEDAISVLSVHDASCDRPDRQPLAERLLVEYQPAPGQKILFVTGQLASAGLTRVLTALGEIDFVYEVRPLEIAVAAWLTVEKIGDEIGSVDGFNAVIIPGKTMGEEKDLEERLGIPVLRGPACYSELPVFLERKGIDVPDDGIVRPRLVFVGKATEYAQQVASTYEVRLLTMENMVESLGDDPLARRAREFLDMGEPMLHNVAAEVVRSRFVMPDVARGFVLSGYPATARDAKWLDEMSVKPDAIIVMEGDEPDISEHYADNPALIKIISSGDVMSDVFTKIETLLRQCIRPTTKEIAKSN